MDKNGSRFEKRLQIELDEIRKDPPPLCSAGLKGDNIRRWIATIQGPPGSLYESGIFQLQLDFASEYPFVPPRVKFLTKIYHCNVDTKGNICLDILGLKWSPAYKVSTLLLSICASLTYCNPNTALNAGIAELYLKNKVLHDANARRFTRIYAIS